MLTYKYSHTNIDINTLDSASPPLVMVILSNASTPVLPIGSPAKRVVVATKKQDSMIVNSDISGD